MGKKKRPFTDWIGFSLLFGLIWFRRIFGRQAALAAGSGLGKIYYLVIKAGKKRYQITADNLRILFPDATDEELDRRIGAVCRHWGRFLLEGSGLSVFDKALADKIVLFNEGGLEIIRQAHGQGKGVIFATAHFGHFELANSAVALHGLPVHSIIRTVDNPMLDKLMDASRNATGLVVIKKENAARDVLRHLRKGDIVTINVDQNAAFNNIFAPFMGKWGATFTTPAIMSQRTGAPIIPLFCVRDDKNDRYMATVHPPVTIEPTGDKNADIRQITMAINARLEEAIRAHPDQWLWVHRRWKTQPNPEELATVRQEEAAIIKALGELPYPTLPFGPDEKAPTS